MPDGLDARVRALGGQLVARLDPINVAIVAGLTDAAATALRAQPDVTDVTDDNPMPARNNRVKRPTAAQLEAATASLPADAPNAAFLPLQWNMQVTAADRAWLAGITGSPDVRVAIVDTGIDPTHPDMIGRVDMARSISFCPGEEPLIAQEFPGYPAWTDLDGHGTFVASIAASNGLLAAGVSSQATLMAVKWDGIVACNASAILRSVIYAADNGADVINLSLTRNAPDPKAGQKGLFHYTNLVVRYALVQGVSAVVVAAGNQSEDLDHNGNDWQFVCDAEGVLCVSATGPTSAGADFRGPFVNVDAPAFYTNYGASAIDVAAPGGNLSFDAAGNLIGEGWIWGACATTDRQLLPNGDVTPGYCTSNGLLVGPWLGTSFAAPHVSGLAGLLVSMMGRDRQAQVYSAIRGSADDRGKPGTDPFYGRGRINIARALSIP